MKRNRVILQLVLILALTGVAGAQDQRDSLRKEILAAVNSCARYMSEVLLDANGKSRCDYQMLEGKWHDYEPPWHTGQIIYALVDAYHLTGNEEYLKSARRGGDWWVSLQIKDHPTLKGMVRAVHGDGINDIVFATVTDGTAGLFRLYEATGEKRYADVPTEAGKWMLTHMYNPENRLFYDRVDPTTGQLLTERTPFRPGENNPTIFDIARPNNEGSLFKDMYVYTKEEPYKKMFLELCESLLHYQDSYGLWMDFHPNNAKDSSFHPRFNLWYAESLLEGYEMTKDKRYLDAALRTGRTHARFQQKDGTFYYTNYLDGRSNQNSLCGSAVAFSGIVWLRLQHYGVGSEFRKNIERSLHWILANRYAADHPDPNLAGGVLETRVRTKGSAVWLTHRDIATSFAVRFLCDYYKSMGK